MKQITGPGLIAGAITWLAIMIYGIITTYRNHLPPISDPCNAIDLLLVAIIGLGALAPAWGVANLFGFLVSDLLRKEKIK